MKQFRSRGSNEVAVLAIGITALFVEVPIAHSQTQPLQPLETSTPTSATRDLYLEVFTDDKSTEWIAHFQETPDGLAIDPEELKNVGIEAHPEAMAEDGKILIERLPGVDFRVDEQAQSIHFEAGIDARSTRLIDAARFGPDPDAPAPQSGYGGVLNYSLFASSNDLTDNRSDYFEGLSVGLDARLFSPLGTLSQSMTVSSSELEFGGLTRLDTTWSYSDPKRMITYRAGDFINRGLSWTRPVRMGGLQIERNFSLRPDLVTIPLPAFGGTAAVPSTVEIFQQNQRAYSGSIPAGPFEISNLPIYTGSGNADIVLRDTLGRETRTSVPFFVSDQLLKQGLWDYSTEIGFPRRNFGIESNDYDDRLMASASVRYGLTDNFTFEGHLEGGEELLNGGIGSVFSIGHYGVASLAGAASHFEGQTGGLVNASVELNYNDYSIFGRVQRTFGDYEDIASVTAETRSHPDYDLQLFGAHAPRTLGQVAVSAPILDWSSLNFSYTYFERRDGDRSQILGASYNQPIFGKGTFYASAYVDLDDSENLGVFGGISIPLGGDVNISTGVDYGPDGTSVVADATKSESHEPGSVGWRLRTSEGAVTNRSAAVSYRSAIARVEGGVQQFEDDVRVTAQAEGSIVAAGGGVFLSNRIDDAFAVVDAGVSDVEVKFQNRSVGKTGRGGRILIPDLNSYEQNQVSIEPAGLPVDASIPRTREIVVPADRSGVVVDFGIEQNASSALVAFIGPDGNPLPVGSSGIISASEQSFFIGYDGEAFLDGLNSTNQVSITLPDGTGCTASFRYQPAPGSQVKIGGAICQ